jgi:glycosyltransferase involved in cell wall biosynthesis
MTASTPIRDLEANATVPPRAQTALSPTKVVVVQSGARDAYQVARALDEAGLLEALVTDLYWPSDRVWASSLAARLPASLRSMLLQRSHPGLTSSRVRLCGWTGLATLLLDKTRGVPFAWRRSFTRFADATLGRAAGMLARRQNAGLLSYSYYGYDAFRSYRRPAMLFQLHPHPASMRRILTAELQQHPDCAESLRKEWELSLPEADFNHLIEETRQAASFLVASTFTKQTLVENGTPASAIAVIPYGVDCNRFSPAPTLRPGGDGPLKLLFVGRINQRKGIKYLLEAVSLLKSTDVHLTVCGRVVDGLDLFKNYAAQVDVRPSVSAEELLAAYRAADLFVFPSVAEGFGQVLLESLASGLPILSTTSTAAPDLIDEGVQGFVVDPRRPDLLAERIDWAATHRADLATMRLAARQRAEQFTWPRFRHGVATAVADFLHQPASPADAERGSRHV